MARFKTIVSTLVILATLCNSVIPAPTEQDDPQNRNLKTAIDQLTKTFLKYIKDDLKPEQNALFSPLNIHTALSLLQLGANGETKTELSKALGIPVDEAGLAAAHNYLGKVLDDFQKSDAAEIKIANSVFLQKGVQLKDSYLQATKNYYKNQAQQVDFAKAGSEATDIVNNWVSDNTKKRIPKLFENAISPATQLLLASALFFNATWQKPFNKRSTTNEKFNTGVKEVEVPTMSQRAYVHYVKDETLQMQAITIPYDSDEFNMIVVLPNTNQSLGAFIDQFTPEQHEQGIKAFSSVDTIHYVEYKIPRFKFGWSQSINNYVIKAGVKKIFGSAELDNMAENASGLQVSDINHAAEIEVNEDGTVATAVTTVGITRTSFEGYPEPIKFYVNRPFLATIYHKKTGFVLFSSIVQNPSS